MCVSEFIYFLKTCWFLHILPNFSTWWHSLLVHQQWSINEWAPTAPTLHCISLFKKLDRNMVSAKETNWHLWLKVVGCTVIPGFRWPSNLCELEVWNPAGNNPVGVLGLPWHGCVHVALQIAKPIAFAPWILEILRRWDWYISFIVFKDT